MAPRPRGVGAGLSRQHGKEVLWRGGPVWAVCVGRGGGHT